MAGGREEKCRLTRQIESRGRCDRSATEGNCVFPSRINPVIRQITDSKIKRATPKQLKKGETVVVHRGFYAFPAKSGKQFATRGWQVSDINERMHICLLSSYLRRTRLDFNPRPSAPFFFRFLERFTTTLRDGRTRFSFFFLYILR